MKNNMMNAVTSLMQNLPAMKKVTKKKGKTSSRRMMSRIQYRYMKGSSQFHHVVDGSIVQSNICSMRLLTKRRHKLQRDICSHLDEDLNLYYKVEYESIYIIWIHRILVA